MSLVFEPGKIRNITLKNRLIRSATWENTGGEEGRIDDQTYRIYREAAHGGAGAVITGFTSVSMHDDYFEGMMRLCDDGLIPRYRKLTDIIHSGDCTAICQLALGAFYRGDSGWFLQTEPDNMTQEEIRLVISLFTDAAERAARAGFDGVQLHAAHFFFLSRFISPAVNHRTDLYGGSVENRTRILTEIIKRIRLTVPDFMVTVKINCSDFIKDGLNEDESLEICRILDRQGIDAIEVSGNGPSVTGIKAHVNEGYFVPSASRIAAAVSCPVIVCGGLRSLDTMEEVLESTPIRFISLSRPLIREPDLPKKMQQDPSAEAQCISCNRCYSQPCHRCFFNKEQF
ncbi:MAG: NADH:flavin oxidoreductase [Solobacterium sp.]|nr:NADH:flavin oxidoreductase [Solobacterium sp.]